MNPNISLLISLSSLLLLHPSTALCVPRNLYSDDPIQPPTVGILATTKAVCMLTSYPRLCVSSVKPFLPCTGGVKVSDVLAMEIKACMRGIESARQVASTISGDSTTPPMMVANLQVCLENYSDAIDNLKNAVRAMDVKDYETINSMLSAAMTDFTTCDDGFMETPYLESPMTAYDSTLSQLVSNSLALALLL